VISADTSKLWATGKTLRSRNGDVKSKRPFREYFLRGQYLQGIQGHVQLADRAISAAIQVIRKIFLKDFFLGLR
jgi:hypothetical protein